MAENKTSETKEVVGVRFVSGVKLYYFDPKNFELKRGDYVIVESQQGLELAKVIYEKQVLDKSKLGDEELLSVVRLATEDDKKKIIDFFENKKEILKKAQEIVRKSKITLHIIDASKSLDDSGRLLFLFAAEGRIDFRDLITELSKEFHLPIRLYQVGARDAARIIGGVGICGQQICCSRFLKGFDSITMEMAREQDLINVGSNKISGVCGKLLCCLNYELEMYNKLKKMMPRLGEEVVTDDGLPGVIIERNVLSQTVVVELHENNIRKLFPVENVKKLNV